MDGYARQPKKGKHDKKDGINNSNNKVTYFVTTGLVSLLKSNSQVH